MRVLVIPDVHLKAWLFDKAEAILEAGKADVAVCLMDIPDDWNMEFQVDRYRETYDRAIAFAKKYSTQKSPPPCPALSARSPCAGQSGLYIRRTG